MTTDAFVSDFSLWSHHLFVVVCVCVLSKFNVIIRIHFARMKETFFSYLDIFPELSYIILVSLSRKIF